MGRTGRQMGPGAFAGLVWLVVSASGCAQLGNYNRQMADVKSAFNVGRYDVAQQHMLDQMGTNWQAERRLNPWLEKAMIHHAAGEFDESARSLETAARIVRDAERQAVVSATDVGAQMATLLLNERAQPYHGEAFEKILIHTINVINYAMRNDWEGARVEVRQAYMRQQELARRHQDAMDELQREPPSDLVDVQVVLQNYHQATADQEAVANRIPNAYQNAFTNFISAVVFNTQREANSAYIELRSAYALRPTARCLGPILIETADRSGFRDDLPGWERAFGLSAAHTLAEEREFPAEVIVLFQDGWAPVKRQITIPIPTRYAIATMALPKYELQGGHAGSLHVSVAGRTARTEVLGDVEAQAVRALRDRMLVYVVKGALRVAGRLAAEYAIQREAGKEHGSQGEMWTFALASAFNVIVEQADLRSWTLAPRTLQAARLRAPAGPATIRLSVPDGGSVDVNMDLRADRPNIVLARYTWGWLTAHTNQGGGAPDWRSAALP